ncbi:DNA polymerase III subunit beta [Tepidimicrobium xylanilyticum]|uniref:DNA polymerase III subunit beta n=1 Tax=Tepidimicrobium xylanilyticum TaxID=1123352 RepID=UPI0026568F52|nr:DNA polymerase III subunit beta [Tepidimicrobium xylanilyticum]GMG96834.1 DNA polymerase III subunit beta [Tepidimicrobium xylanilyticum]
MKIKINAKFLQNMLKKAKGLQLNKLNPDLEFQRGLLIKDNRLIMNNLKTQLESKFHIDVLEPGKTLIPEQTLKMLENFKNGELTITDNEIIHGTRKLKFMPGDIEQFSVINNEISEELFTISETELSHLLEVNYATTQDETRPVLKGIKIEDNRFLALNGYYLSMIKANFYCNQRIILSEEVWKVLLKTLDKKSDAQVKVFWNGSNLVKFEFEDFIVKGNLYNDKFFDVEKVIYDNPETEFTIETNKLLDTLKLMDKLTKDEQMVILYINDDKLKLKTKTDINIMTDEIDITDKYGEDVNIAFNIKYLLAVINQYKNENVRVQLKGPNDPMILKGHDKLDLVLPVRLREW